VGSTGKRGEYRLSPFYYADTEGEIYYIGTSTNANTSTYDPIRFLDHSYSPVPVTDEEQYNLTSAPIKVITKVEVEVPL
jgi:hypothetical protein